MKLDSLNGKTCLVTGASGFIGSHLTNRLLQLGAKVDVVTRYGNVVKNERLKALWDDIGVYEANIVNRGSLTNIPMGYNAVFHLGAYNHVGQSFTQVEECFDVNAKGTANLVDYVGPDTRLVYVSSSEVYGKQVATPWVEMMTPNPESPYGVTKLAGEMYCRLKQRQGFNINIVRPFNAYGEYQSTKAVIPHIITTLLSGKELRTTRGEQTREFNYVGDLVDGIILAGVVDRYEGPVNLCCGKDYRIADVVRKIMGEIGMRGMRWSTDMPYRPNEIWEMSASNRLAMKNLGWYPEVDFDEGIKKTVEWFKGMMSY